MECRQYNTRQVCMEIIKNKEFGGERPLFATHDLRLENITITDGESGIKQCQRMEAKDCRFYGKYPWWHVDGALIEDCTIDKACDRMFEYSTVEADICGHIENIKNPTSGHIVADSIGSITIDENVRQPNDCVIEVRSKMEEVRSMK